MNDEQILERGGTEEDIIKYSKQNGADLTKEDFMPNTTNEWEENFTKKLLVVCAAFEAAADNSSDKLEVWEQKRNEFKQYFIDERAKLIKEIEEKLPEVGAPKQGNEITGPNYEECAYFDGKKDFNSEVKSLLNSLKV